MRVQLGAFWIDDPTDQQMTEMWFVKHPLNEVVVNLGPTMSALQATVVQEILAERQRQDELWGVQHHPNFPEMEDTPAARSLQANMQAAMSQLVHLVQTTVNLSEGGQRAWAVIFLEEVFEAMNEPGDWQACRKELVQCAAVILNWIEDGDLREIALEERSVERERH
jgi:hypothetical protein